MNQNYINICFIVDESSSMGLSINDVKQGFKTMIEEQKKIENGKCTVSLFRFASTVKEDFIGKDVSEIDTIDYKPWGSTAMNDGIGMAITKLGQWLNDMKEEDKPSKNLIVIMTDGEENASKEYTFAKVKEMIKHQEEKYNWSFVYMGTDLTSMKDVENLGIKMSSFSSRRGLAANYDLLNATATAYRCATTVTESLATMDCLMKSCADTTKAYEEERNIKLNID